MKDNNKEVVDTAILKKVLNSYCTGIRESVLVSTCIKEYLELLELKKKIEKAQIKDDEQ